MTGKILLEHFIKEHSRIEPFHPQYTMKQLTKLSPYLYFDVLTRQLCCSDLPPSQGGKYVGFGNDPTPQKKNDDLVASLSSVSAAP